MDPVELRITIERVELRPRPGLHEVAKGFERHVDADLVAVLEAVGHGLCLYGTGTGTPSILCG